MPPQNSQPPKSALSQSLSRFLVKTVEVLGAWQHQQRESEKRAVAKAKFPGLEALCLFGLHSVLGFVLATLSGVWAIAAWVIVIGISLYCTLLALFIDGSLLPNDWLWSVVWEFLAQPWSLTAEQLDSVLRRWILGQFRHELAVDFWKAVARVFCFVALGGWSGLGLWAGYRLATQFW